MLVVGDEANPLTGYVLIKFIPVCRLGLEDQAALHRRRIIKFDLLLQNSLGDQDAGVFTPLLRCLALRGDDLVEVGTRWDANPEPVIFLRVLRHVMKDWHGWPPP